jgi:hypothetical protein
LGKIQRVPGRLMIRGMSAKSEELAPKPCIQITEALCATVGSVYCVFVMSLSMGSWALSEVA